MHTCIICLKIRGDLPGTVMGSVCSYNQRHDPMRTRPFITAAVIGGALLFTSCGRDPGEETERVDEQKQENAEEMAKADDSQEWMKERNEAVRELTDLRENMNNRLTREQKRLADGIKNAERRAECENHIKELQANIAQIDASLTRMNATTGTDWSTMKGEMRTMKDSTDNWFKRQSEKIDRNTDADGDKDGH